jgi:hypothetical protein
MANPLTAPVLTYASRLRFPTLFKITLALMVLSWLLPDPIPFLDEIVTAMATLVLASWKRPAGQAQPPAREGATIEGESRRE